MFGWRYRSNGVQVSRAAHRAISAANAARDALHWDEAATAYERALAIDPSLHHIRMQLGHALKEAGRHADASQAYRRVASERPGDAEPLIHLGHLAKRDGRRAMAAGHYIDALALGPDIPDAWREAFWALQNAPLDRASLVRVSRAFGLADGEAIIAEAEAAADRHAATPPHLLYDITDLVGYFHARRIVSGIQRVQIEVVRKALAADGTAAAVCFVPTHAGWHRIEPAEFESLTAAAARGEAEDDPDWHRALFAFHARLAARAPLSPAPGMTLISLSPGWTDPDRLAASTRFKREGGRLVPLIYDLIPILYPQYFAGSLAADFSKWLRFMIETADHFLTISRQTANDLVHLSGAFGAVVAPERVTTVPLDADFAVEPADPAELARLGLTPDGFVLLVSTFEPRKNHQCAFAAWRILAERIGAHNVPPLVCVGGRGWLSDRLRESLTTDPFLRRHVRWLQGVTDGELALLYRTCLCTLYPSLYEGWGLPVTESLCYGKVPVASDAGSIPEAGNGYAVYFDPTRADDLVRAITPIMTETGLRDRLEREISRHYRPRSWAAIAEAIRAAAY